MYICLQNIIPRTLYMMHTAVLSVLNSGTGSLCSMCKMQCMGKKIFAVVVLSAGGSSNVFFYWAVFLLLIAEDSNSCVHLWIWNFIRCTNKVTSFSVNIALLSQFHCILTLLSKRWVSNPGVPSSKPLGGSKVDSAFLPSEIDKMSFRNSWELSGKK